MSLLIVASDSPGAGKTAATLALAQISKENGGNSSAFKPFALAEDDPDQAVFNDLANPAPDGWPIRIADSGPTRDDMLHSRASPVHSCRGRQSGDSRDTQRDRRGRTRRTRRRLGRQRPARRRLPTRPARIRLE